MSGWKDIKPEINKILARDRIKHVLYEYRETFEQIESIPGVISNMLGHRTYFNIRNTIKYDYRNSIIYNMKTGQIARIPQNY